ncbi:MAG: pyridoxamine 5'-phosphate oxidase family protein, partial [Rhodoblastus sp.]|nr:pyridoxamine 5'-phosphate oxidase family protein [Rhodoblastus sp.]
MDQSIEARQKVWDLIKNIRVAMFVTQDSDGRLAARPMSAVNKTFDGALWFMTAGDSAKLDELRASTNVL